LVLQVFQWLIPFGISLSFPPLPYGSGSVLDVGQCFSLPNRDREGVVQP